MPPTLIAPEAPMSKRSAPFETAEKLLSLVQRVDRGQTLRLKDIEDELGVKSATAREYREFVQRVRPELVERRGRRGVKEWYIPGPEASSPRDGQRAAALSFALEALRGLEGTTHYDLLKDLAEEHRNRLGDDLSTYERLGRSFIVRPVEHPRSGQRRAVLRGLLAALEEPCQCQIRYVSLDGESRSYELDPWGLVFHRDELFFLAGKRVEGQRNRQRRLFSIDGIEEVKRWSGEEIRRPPSDLRALFEHAIGVYALDEEQNPPVDLHLQVRGGHAVRLQRRAIHTSQQISPAQDGWFDLRVRVGICPQVKSWIRSMLPDVRVVSPSGLRDEITQELRRYLQSIDA